MLVTTVVLAFAIALAALVYVVWPLLHSDNSAVMLDDDLLAELLGQKDAALRAIRDLEFDYQVGKLGSEDFERFDQRLRRQAVALIRQIEQIAPDSASLDDPLEEQIARYRKVAVDGARTAAAVPSPLVPPQAAPPPPDGAAAPDGSVPLRADQPRFCTECGSPLAAGHKFCAHCGAPVIDSRVTAAP